jgi:hypothetical protein
MTDDGSGQGTAEPQATGKTWRRRFHRLPKPTVGGSLLLVVAIGFPAAAAWLAFAFFNEFKATALPSKDAIPLLAYSASSRGEGEECTSETPGAEIPIVRLIAHTWDPRASTLALDEELCVPYTMLEHLRTAYHRSLFESRSAHTPFGPFDEKPIRPQYARDKLSLQYTPLTPGETISSQVPFPEGVEGPTRSVTLSQLSAAESKFIQLGTIHINVNDTAPLYPFDQYATNGGLSLELAPTSFTNLIMLNETIGKEKLAESETLPFHLLLFVSSGISPLGLTATTNRPESFRAEVELPGASHELGLRMERWTITIAYVLLIVAIPFLIEVLLVILLVRQNSGVRAPELLAGAATVLLAILPIRQVLVPPSVEELTLIDYLLGVEVAILVSIGCAAVWRARKGQAGTRSGFGPNRDPA